MRSSRPAAVLLLLVGAVLIAGNVYETLRRSTIPLAMGGTVIELEVRHEKHPGIDDVHLVHTGKDTYHVDEAVAAEINGGDRVEKAAWSRSLRVDDEEVGLQLSQDFRGMLIVMPLAAAVCVFLVLTREER